MGTEGRRQRKLVTIVAGVARLSANARIHIISVFLCSAHSSGKQTSGSRTSCNQHFNCGNGTHTYTHTYRKAQRERESEKGRASLPGISVTHYAYAMCGGCLALRWFYFHANNAGVVYIDSLTRHGAKENEKERGRESATLVKTFLT